MTSIDRNGIRMVSTPLPCNTLVEIVQFPSNRFIHGKSRRADERIQTPDLLVATELLYLLSHVCLFRKVSTTWEIGAFAAALTLSRRCPLLVRECCGTHPANWTPRRMASCMMRGLRSGYVGGYLQVSEGGGKMGLYRLPCNR